MMPKSGTVETNRSSAKRPVAPATAGSLPLPSAYSPRWSKLQIVSSQMEELAVRLGPGAQLPRVTDLCKQIGASITTVNAALGDLENRGILLRRPGVGNFVASNLHRANVLLLCNSGLLSRPELSPFWAMLIQSAKARATSEALGFDLQFAEPAFGSPTLNAPEISDSVAHLIGAGRVNGAVAIGLDAPPVHYLERQGIPVVSFAGPSNYAVIHNMPDLILKGVRALAEAGAKRIALWSPLQNFVAVEKTVHFQEVFYQAFQSALADVGLPFEAELVQQNSHRATTPGSFTETPYQRQGYETALAVFGDNPDGFTVAATPPDAVLCTDDMMTAGALPALRRCGITVYGKKNAVPKSILFATHANVGSPVLTGYEDDLIIVEMDPADVAEALFQLLERLMAGDTTVSSRTLVSARLKLPAQRLLTR
ncbi:MAG: GntR family transcriptional regulator [Armatimonadota bacterium]